MDAVIPEEWRTLTNIQRDILTVLAAEETATVREIADNIGTGPVYSTVSRNLSELRGRGLVESAATPEDERFVMSWLTDDGRVLVRLGVVQVAARLDLEVTA